MDLQQMRKGAGLSRREVSEKTGVSIHAIVKYELSARMPRSEQARKVIEFFAQLEKPDLAEIRAERERHAQRLPKTPEAAAVLARYDHVIAEMIDLQNRTLN